MKGIQVYSNEGPNPLQKGVITRVQKWGGVIYMFSSHEPQYRKISDLHDSFLA
jgi:hypothetical protein